MKFHIAINLERMDETTSMTEVKQHTIDMIKMADKADFAIAWAAEHHALEMTIAPNPFQLLTWWAENTEKIRLGSGVVNASYWHPIRLAAEAAMLDVISGGRLEFGIGSGAYQREFNRMHPGLMQPDSWQYMQEMLPVVLKLWQGDVAHDGKYWQFPTATSCPKPIQSEVPVWAAARSPITFDYAIKNRCNIISWPFTRPFSEVQLYKSHLDEAIKKNNSNFVPTFAMMRHTAIYTSATDKQKSLDAVRGVLGQFENLMRNSGKVINGFPTRVELESLNDRDIYNPDSLVENLMFGTPDQVIDKIKQYEDLGIDAFIYYASMGLDMATQKKSLALFINEVMPAFK